MDRSQFARETLLQKRLRYGRHARIRELNWTLVRRTLDETHSVTRTAARLGCVREALSRALHTKRRLAWWLATRARWRRQHRAARQARWRARWKARRARWAAQGGGELG